MKRIIGIILTMCLLLEVFPAGVLTTRAEVVAEGTWGDNITWELSGDTLTLRGIGAAPEEEPEDFADCGSPWWPDYEYEIKNVIIEDGITFIGGGAFKGLSHLQSVSIADTVKGIGKYTFQQISALKAVELPSSLEYIGLQAFYSCGITSVVIPDSVTTIDDNAFCDCSDLESVWFPESLTTIGTIAFADCDSLTEVVLPSKLSTLGRYAFENCDNLSTVYWPRTLARVYAPFMGCQNLSAVYYEGSEEEWESIWAGSGGKVPEGTTVYFNCEMPEIPVAPSFEAPVPVLNTITTSEESITIDWLHPLQIEGSECWADGYYVYRKTPGESYQKIATLSGKDNTSYVDTEVTPGVTYTYTVESYVGEYISQRDENGLTATFLGKLADVTDYTEDFGIQTLNLTAYENNYVAQVPYIPFSCDFTIEVLPEEALAEEYVTADGYFNGNFALYNEAGQLLCICASPEYVVETNRLKITYPVNSTGFYSDFAIGEDATLLVYGNDGMILGRATLPSVTFQRWGFGNYNLSSNQTVKEISKDVYGGPRTWVLGLNEDFGKGLCSGFSMGVSAANSAALDVKEVTGYSILNDIKWDALSSGLVRSVGYDSVNTVEDLIILFYLMQFQPDTEQEEIDNEWDFSGMMMAIDDYIRNDGMMPIVCLDYNGVGHALAAYGYLATESDLTIHVYDPNNPYAKTSITVTDYNGSSPVWSFGDFGSGTKGSENVISYTVPVVDLPFFDSMRTSAIDMVGEYTLAMLEEEMLSVLQEKDTLQVIPIGTICNQQTQELAAVEEELCWISGSGMYTLESLQSILYLADDNAAYSILAEKAEFVLDEADNHTVQQIGAEADSVEISCVYPAENGTLIHISFQGTPAEEKITLCYDPDSDTVKIDGAEEGTVTVTHDDEDETTQDSPQWCAWVHSKNQTIEITADGEAEPDIAVPDAPHAHIYEDAVSLPTCTEQGYTTHTCDCGDSYVDTYTAALGHDYVAGVCTRCGAEKLSPDTIIRIAGADRIGTSLMLADQLKEVLDVDKFDSVIVASALNFPDALTGSYLAAVKNAPILLTYPAAHERITEYIADDLANHGIVYILGGESAVDKDFENMVTAKGLTVKRVAGTDRFGTNLAIMQEAGVSADQPVLIATALNFADSLSASAAGLPMVLVYGSLRPDQKDFLATTSRNFIIIGGTSAVNESLEAELRAIGTVERLAGAGRYQTSVMVAQKFAQNPDAVVLAYARNFPDGLCGGPLAYALGAPLILTDNYDPSEADKYVEGITAGIVVGGSGLISDETMNLIFDMD